MKEMDSKNKVWSGVGDDTHLILKGNTKVIDGVARIISKVFQDLGEGNFCNQNYFEIW